MTQIIRTVKKHVPKATPQQNLDFQIYLLNKRGMESTAFNLRTYIENRNYPAITQLVEELMKLGDRDSQKLAHDIRVNMSAIALETIEHDVNTAGGLEIE